MLISISRLLPLGFYRRLGHRPFLPYYHVISDEPLPHMRYLFPYKTPGAFVDDIELLLRMYTPVALPDLIAHVHEGRALPPHAMHLSFDDGFAESYSVIAPILHMKGVPATFFIPADFIDNRKLFYRHAVSLVACAISDGLPGAVLREAAAVLDTDCAEPHVLMNAALKLSWWERGKVFFLAERLGIDVAAYLGARRPYLTSDQVRSLLYDGFTVGAHGLEHEDFSMLPTAEQVHVARASTGILAGAFNLPYQVFSFPFGDSGVTGSFFRAVRSEIELVFGGANMKRDEAPFVLHRSNIEDPSVPLDDKLKMLYSCYFWRRITGKGRIERGIPQRPNRIKAKKTVAG